MSINRISLYHLETLLSIARLGTFAAAAERLNTTQPAISARVGELEERLGTRLFRRQGRRADLTPAGRELVRAYLPIWEELQSVLLRSAGFDQMRGVVRIGAGEIAAATCLPRFVSEMKGRYANLIFEIEIELTAPMVQALLTGRNDLAFAAGSIAHPGLTAFPIGTVELLWVASPSVACLTDECDPTGAPIPLWSLPRHSPIHQLMKGALENRPFLQKSINLCNNVRTMIDIVASGDGFSLVPSSMVVQQIDSGRLVPVLTDLPVQPIMFHVVSRAGETDPVVNQVIVCAGAINMLNMLALDFGTVSSDSFKSCQCEQQAAS